MNPISWVEIPVSDLQRAIHFYNVLFDWDLKALELGELSMALFPSDAQQPGCGGSLVLSEHYTPGQQGMLIYLECEDVQVVVDRVEAASGKVLRGKTQVSPQFGYMGLATDSEGNRIAFHSKS